MVDAVPWSTPLTMSCTVACPAFNWREKSIGTRTMPSTSPPRSMRSPSCMLPTHTGRRYGEPCRPLTACRAMGALSSITTASGAFLTSKDRP